MSLAPRHDRFSRESDSDLALPGGAASQRDEHPKAVKPFVVEVSADRPIGVNDPAPPVARRVDAAESRSSVAPVRALPTAPAAEHGGDIAGDVMARGDAGPSSTDAELLGLREAPRSSAPAIWGLGRRTTPGRRVSSWSTSFMVHAAIAGLLSLITISQIQPKHEMDVVVAAEPLEDVDFADADVKPLNDVEEIAESFDAPTDQLIDPGKATLGMEAGDGLRSELTDEFASASTGFGGEGTAPGGLGGMGGLFGNGNGGTSEFGSGLGAAPATPQFFGAKIEGRRIVFVLDNSGSMQGGRLETVNAELERCVASLDPDQEFYVIFYSDMPYPLFYPDPVDRYVRPTPRNRELLHDWLATVELCLGDAVLDALNAAAFISPDTVLLLSDGRISGERKMAALLNGGGDFPLHTIGVGLGGAAAASRRNLADIATANGGDFREAQVPAEMKELARRDPRPYHAEGPGVIWGRNVKGWKR
jgi:hypothetical protein